MGIIRGFLAGAGKGMADVSQMLLADKLSKERDEAEYLRRRELQGESQNYGTSERGASQTFQSSEKKLDREATKVMNDADNAAAVDTAKAKGTEAAKDTTNTQRVNEIIRDMGVSRRVAEIVAKEGVSKTINNADGIQTMMDLDLETGEWKIDSSVVPGKRKQPAQQLRADGGEVPQPFSMFNNDGLINGAMGEQGSPNAAGNPLNSQTTVKQKTVTSSQYDARMIDKYPELKNNSDKLKELRDAARKRGQISQ